MAGRSIINVNNAPAAIGPYSQGVKYCDLIFVSGQLPIDPATNQMVANDISQQTHQVIKNLKNILESTGGTLFNVIKTTVFLASMDDFDAMNKVYAQYFSHEPPARACVEVSRLPKNARVEIEAIAHLPKPKNMGSGLLY